MLSIGNSKTKKEKQLRSGGGHNHLMPKLILEPDSTGGESKKKQKQKGEASITILFCCRCYSKFLEYLLF
jgi:hypothetical protein